VKLSQVDLNLFTVFDAIYREGGITAAAKRLHLSQPAVSHALARLRELLGDALFERRGNEMVATPAARTLASTVSGSLSDLEQVLQRLGQFDAAQSRRRFTLATRPWQELALLPELMSAIDRAAPYVELAVVRSERRALEDALESGELDAAVDVAFPHAAEVRRERLATEPLVVLARRDHPALGGELDLSTYLEQAHVLVTGRSRGGGYEDMALARLGATRRIRVRCQQHAAASELVTRSDLLLTLTRSQAATVNRRTRNRVFAFPAEIPPMQVYLYWHASNDGDAASRWFRSLIVASLRKRAK
jgi:DNA-binding transcriptional LysR family regulator